MHVVCGVLIRDSKFFLAKRPEGKNLPNHWEFPGGKVENDESFEMALKREWQEELQLNIVVLDKIASFENDQLTLHSYFIESSSNQTPVINEHQAFGWFNYTQTKQLLMGKLDLSIINFLNK